MKESSIRLETSRIFLQKHCALGRKYNDGWGLHRQYVLYLVPRSQFWKFVLPGVTKHVWSIQSQRTVFRSLNEVLTAYFFSLKNDAISAVVELLCSPHLVENKRPNFNAEMWLLFDINTFRWPLKYNRGFLHVTLQTPYEVPICRDFVPQ